MKEIQIIIKIKTFEKIEELALNEKLLIQEAQQAAETAYAPYSKYAVGAALLLDNGVVVRGSNQENAAYPSGLCAERVALFYANSQYPEAAPLMLAITAIKDGIIIENPIAPCAACRQVMLEVETRFRKSFKLLLYGENKILLVENAGDLVPLKFNEQSL